MSLKQQFSEYSCIHDDKTDFELFDYLENKITFSLCPDCQKISEFAKLINRNENLKNEN